MLNIFEQKNNTIASMLISIAAISGALFGLISGFASDTKTPPLLFITLGIGFSLIISTVLGFISSNNHYSILKLVATPNKKLSILEKQFRKTAILRSLSGLCFVATMAGFYLLNNKIIGVLISETYPIFAILISYFLLKNNLKTGNILYDWLLIGMSFIGVIILFTKEIYLLESSLKGIQYYGVLLSVIGTILASYAAVLSPIMTIQLSKIQGRSNIRSALGSQFITNLIMFIALLLLSVIFYTSEHFINLLNYKVLILALLFGIFVDFISTFLSRIGVAIATSHNIYLIWFLTPIIGIFLLWIFGYGEINATIMLSLILILVPNLLLNLDIEKSFSFKATFIWILLFTIVLFYSQGKSIDNETYFNSANALLVFFALMIGYLINKLNQRSDFRERLFMQFLHKIRADGVDEWAIESISAKFQQANNRLTDKVKDELSKFNINTGKYSELLDFKFIQNRRLYNVGELFVLLLISLLLIGITTVYRDNSFLYDSYAFIVNTAVVFTLAQVVERMFFSEYQQHKTMQNIFMENIIGMVFLAILIITIIILFLSKHNFNI